MNKNITANAMKATPHSKKMARQTTMTNSEKDGANMPDIASLTSEIQNLEWWSNFWSKTGLILGALTAAFGVLSAFSAGASYWYGTRLKPVQDELAQIKEDQLARDLKDKEEKIAATKEETARVDAESREKAAQLAKEAEALKAEAEKAKANIATAQADAARADQRTQELAIEAADARRRQAEAERALLELQEESKPRHLTDQQRELLSNIVRDATSELVRARGGVRPDRVPVEMWYPDNDLEAATFAREIKDALWLGWFRVGDIKPVDFVPLFEEFGRGVLFGVTIKTEFKSDKFPPNSPSAEPPEADILGRAFAAIGIEAKRMQHVWAKAQDNAPIIIIIGAKPSPRLDEERRRELEERRERTRKLNERWRREEEELNRMLEEERRKLEKKPEE